MGFQHIDEATRSGNDDFNTSGEVTNLRTLGSAAINRCVTNPRVRTRGVSELSSYQVKGSLPKFGAFLLDLNGKLASWRKDQCYWAIPGVEQGLTKVILELRVSAKGRDTDALMCNIAGKAKEIVFPLPVWAMATRSRPLSAIGHA